MDHSKIVPLETVTVPGRLLSITIVFCLAMLWHLVLPTTQLFALNSTAGRVTPMSCLIEQPQVGYALGGEDFGDQSGGMAWATRLSRD